ncbi:Os06g0141600 [Oryza sativa Japonica Group]|uniref:Os06g0141600 protein n=2 Tax=Oryza sativa subsp. japonica TaxID=39947 RepID=Q0DEP8_ORYSJ|nr:hypothetical protein EE612_031848 [Oryza sativa]BAF18675.1 Os06g0141600 [Oryza sativa Japonica Group]BAG87116.1 unnamed protein product [Oryza sativa Japonica Group]BAS96087.1 Os06g0141600 [Oryza sativa Japonica Group]|eukprot:NP_001056761.1 Os06g0141600 [Oryza sativa Japonica Group]
MLRRSAEANLAGVKAAAVATIASAVPTVSSLSSFSNASSFLCQLILYQKSRFSNLAAYACVCCLFQLASVRMVPWAKANINPTGQALIICTAAGMAYFVAADKKILSLARRHSFENAPEHLKNTSFQGTGRPHPAFFRP